MYSLGLFEFEQSLLLVWKQPCSCAKLPIPTWEREEIGGKGGSKPWLELEQGARTDALRKDSSLRLEIFKALDLFESFHGLALRVLLSYSHGWSFR